jgi:hypothetical protein
VKSEARAGTRFDDFCAPPDRGRDDGAAEEPVRARASAAFEPRRHRRPRGIYRRPTSKHYIADGVELCRAVPRRAPLEIGGPGALDFALDDLA